MRRSAIALANLQSAFCNLQFSWACLERALIGGAFACGDQALVGAVDLFEEVRVEPRRALQTLGRNGLQHVPGRPVEPVGDPTGAGDAFGAAYLVARADGNGPVGAARRASGVVADLLSGRLR